MVQVLLSTLSKSITKFFTLNFYMIDCLRPEFNQISGNLHQPTNTLLFFCLGGVTVEAVKLVSGCSCGRCHETTPVLISQPPYKFRTRKWRLYRNDIGISHSSLLEFVTFLQGISTNATWCCIQWQCQELLVDLTALTLSP